MKTLTQKLTTAAFALALPIAAMAQPKVSTSVEVWSKDVLSRGFVLSQDPYIMPEVMLSTQDGNSYIYTEQKYNLANRGESYSTWIGAGTNFKLPGANLNVELGHLALTGGVVASEIYTATTIKAPLNPTIEAVFSGGDFPGQYYSFGLSQSAKLGKATASISGKIGFNDHYAIHDAAFTHVTID